MPMPPLHPACAWPLPAQDELAAITDSIRENGLREPITMLNGMILDGRVRWLCCERAGVEPRTEEFTGDNPVLFVFDKNERRRKGLNEPERARIAERLANVPQGGVLVNTSTPPLSYITRAQAAKLMGLKRNWVDEARTLREHAAPHVVAMIGNGVSHQRAARAVQYATLEEQAIWASPADVRAASARHRADRANAAAAAGLPPPRNGSPTRAQQAVIQQQAAPARSPVTPPPSSPAPRPPRSYQEATGRSLIPTRLTREEAGIPETTDPNIVGAHFERYGRAQSVAAAVHDIRDDLAMVAERVDSLQMLLAPQRRDQGSPETFVAALQRALVGIAHLRQPHFVCRGWDEDHPAKARRHLRDLQRMLPQAITLLQAYAAALTTLEQPGQRQPAADDAQPEQGVH